MLNPFHYSKAKHKRTRTPPLYSNYRQYKPELQIEFSAQCVYCRALDRLKGYESFGVDHYRPQKDFPHLVTEYLNLFYACNRCNNLKRRFWPNPQEERDGIFIPNPCEHLMFDHLRYIRGKVQAHSNAGVFTMERLDLNDPVGVDFREGFITMLAAMNSEMEGAKHLLIEAQTTLDHATTKAAQDVAREVRDQVKENLEKLQTELKKVLG